MMNPQSTTTILEQLQLQGKEFEALAEKYSKLANKYNSLVAFIEDDSDFPKAAITPTNHQPRLLKRLPKGIAKRNLQEFFLKDAPNQALSVNEIVERSGLARSTVAKLCEVLTKKHWLKKNNHRYFHPVQEFSAKSASREEQSVAQRLPVLRH